MENGRLQIVDVNVVLGRVIAQVVGRAECAMPALTPPPAIQMVKRAGGGRGPGTSSRRASSFIDVRPNSPPQMTSVSSSRPRCFRSLSRAATGRSVSLHFLGRT